MYLVILFTLLSRFNFKKNYCGAEWTHHTIQSALLRASQQSVKVSDSLTDVADSPATSKSKRFGLKRKDLT